MVTRSGRCAPALLLALLGLSGCITDHGTLQVAALERAPESFEEVEIRTLPVRREVVGRDTRVTSVLVVPTFVGPRLENAVADALAQGGGDVLLGARVRTIDYWFLVGWSVLEVRGDVVDAGARGSAR
jgi:hypothetical protein